MQNSVVFYGAQPVDPEDLVSLDLQSLSFLSILDLEDGVVVYEEDLFGLGRDLYDRIIRVGSEVLYGCEIGGIPDSDVPAELGDEEVALEIEDVFRGLRDVEASLPSESIGRCQGQQQKC